MYLSNRVKLKLNGKKYKFEQEIKCDDKKLLEKLEKENIIKKSKEEKKETVKKKRGRKKKSTKPLDADIDFNVADVLED